MPVYQRFAPPLAFVDLERGDAASALAGTGSRWISVGNSTADRTLLLLARARRCARWDGRQTPKALAEARLFWVPAMHSGLPGAVREECLTSVVGERPHLSLAEEWLGN